LTASLPKTKEIPASPPCSSSLSGPSRRSQLQHVRTQAYTHAQLHKHTWTRAHKGTNYLQTPRPTCACFAARGFPASMMLFKEGNSCSGLMAASLLTRLLLRSRVCRVVKEVLTAGDVVRGGGGRVGDFLMFVSAVLSSWSNSQGVGHNSSQGDGLNSSQGGDHKGWVCVVKPAQWFAQGLRTLNHVHTKPTPCPQHPLQDLHRKVLSMDSASS